MLQVLSRENLRTTTPYTESDEVLWKPEKYFTGYTIAIYPGGAVLKSQTYMSTKVLSRENLRTTTPFTVFGILVPKYYSIFEANWINTTLFWINLPLN